MSRYYEITDGDLHVGWASEDYMFTKMDERVLKGEAKFNFHVGDRDAEDVVPVVRCMDCRYYRFHDGTFGKGWMCFENNTARQGNDYCSRGERKEE